jgi:hypothetical protein
MAPNATRAVRSSGRCRRPWFGLALLLAAIPAVTPAAQEEPLARFSSGVQAVEVYATVTDSAGEPVTGLRADDFQLDDDGRRQAITTFAEGAFPLTVALGVDRSLSMAGEPLRLARQAAQGFLQQLRPGDRSMVVAINAGAEVVAPLDAPREAQLRAIAALAAGRRSCTPSCSVAGLCLPPSRTWPASPAAVRSPCATPVAWMAPWAASLANCGISTCWDTLLPAPTSRAAGIRSASASVGRRLVGGAFAPGTGTQGGRKTEPNTE